MSGLRHRTNRLATTQAQAQGANPVKRERLYFSGTRRRATRYVGVQKEVEDRLDEQPTVVSRFAMHRERRTRPALRTQQAGQLLAIIQRDRPGRPHARGAASSSATAARSACLAPSHADYVLSLWLPVQLPLRAAAQVWLPKDAAFTVTATRRATSLLPAPCFKRRPRKSGTKQGLYRPPTRMIPPSPSRAP